MISRFSVETSHAEALPAPLTQGQYTVSGLGGIDVGPFGPTNLNVPTLLDVTNSLAPGTVISRQNPLTLTWTGGNANDIVVIHGRVFVPPDGVTPPFSDPLRFRSQCFVCTTTAGNLQFTIPAYVLSNLPLGSLAIHVTHMPSADGIARFEASGLDAGGVFRWINTTNYLHLVLGP